MPDLTQMQELIITIIEEKPGIKITELVAYFSRYKYDFIYIDTLDQMVREGHIIELEYVLPTMDYRVKSMYFPKGTKIKILE
jgi:predicted phage-related endonuclease